jgi:hypothetical protein
MKIISAFVAFGVGIRKLGSAVQRLMLVANQVDEPR